MGSIRITLYNRHRFCMMPSGSQKSTALSPGLSRTDLIAAFIFKLHFCRMLCIWFHFPSQNVSYVCYMSDATLNTRGVKLKCLPEERHLEMVDTAQFKDFSLGFGKKKKILNHTGSIIVACQFLCSRPYDIS